MRARSSPRSSFVLDGRNEPRDGWGLAVENASVAVAPNRPSRQDGQRGEPFAVTGGGVGDGRRTPWEELLAARWCVDGGTYPS